MYWSRTQTRYVSHSDDCLYAGVDMVALGVCFPTQRFLVMVIY